MLYKKHVFLSLVIILYLYDLCVQILENRKQKIINSSPENINNDKHIRPVVYFKKTELL